MLHFRQFPSDMGMRKFGELTWTETAAYNTVQSTSVVVALIKLVIMWQGTKNKKLGRTRVGIE